MFLLFINNKKNIRKRKFNRKIRDNYNEKLLQIKKREYIRGGIYIVYYLVHCFSFTDFFETWSHISHVYIVRACIGDKKPVFSTIFATIKRLTSSWNRQGCTRTSVLSLVREKSIFRIFFQLFPSCVYVTLIVHFQQLLYIFLLT